MNDFFNNFQTYLRFDEVPEILLFLLMASLIAVIFIGVKVWIKNKHIVKQQVEFDKLSDAYQKLTHEHDDLLLVVTEEQEKNQKLLEGTEGAKETCENAYTVLETALVNLSEYIDKDNV